jgi:hypothetical protein
MKWLPLLILFSISCRAQNDSCSGNNPPYPIPPHCDNFTAQDSIQICYTFTAPDNAVYLNPFVLSTCGATNLVISLYDSACNFIGNGSVGYNALTQGANYTVCFQYTCDLSLGVFSGVCFFEYLPIELLYFDAKKVDNFVKLGWATASEVNNDYFSVERSTNGKGFHQLSIIDGAGNSTVVNQYSYRDYQPYSENYYRLAQHDYDGKIQLSEIRYVKMENSSIQVYTVYGQSIYIGSKKNFQPPSGIYVVFEDGSFKKYLKP